MNTAIHDIRRIWRITTVQRNERAMLLLGWLALTAAALGEIGAAVAVLTHKASPLLLLRVPAGVAAFWLGFAWMSAFVPGSILLNSPANARLVPRQRRRLLQMAAGGWCLVAAGMTFALGSWAAFPAAGIALIGFALMRAGRNEMGLVFVLCLNWPSLSRHLLPPAVVQAVDSDAGLWLLTVLLLPAGAWALRTLYPAAGDTHLARRGDQVERVGQRKRWNADALGPFSKLIEQRKSRFYMRMLQRDLRRLQPGPLLMHALGPAAHWSVWLGSALSIVTMGAGVRLLLAWRGEGGLHAPLPQMLSIGIAAAVLVIAYSTAAASQQIRKTGGEQALLRLTPLAGQAALLNRRLARELLAHALRSWLVLSAAVLLATLLVGGGLSLLVRQAALCVLAGQVAAMGLLGDHAGEGGWNLPLALGAGLLAAAELLAALLLERFSGVSLWAWVTPIALGAGAWQLRRSWRAMLASKPAFPAGRS